MKVEVSIKSIDSSGVILQVTIPEKYALISPPLKNEKEGEEWLKAVEAELASPDKKRKEFEKLVGWRDFSL